ncbi:MAG: hypothetical protein KAT78_08485, partial [Flavobacteriaceae bacterium]|nr:hypothetical protein [Flavobacteriaceae bacterium]
MISKTFISNLKELFFIILMIFGMTIYAQKQNNQDTYINNKLLQIDSLIKGRQFDKAKVLIKNTQRTFSFRNDIEDKLAFDF